MTRRGWAVSIWRSGKTGTNSGGDCAIAHLWCPVAAGSVEETLLLGSASGQPVPSAKVSKSGSRNSLLNCWSQ